MRRTYDDIHISDDVFVSIFDLFDGYQWHLDDRPTGDPNEINPDVLGHIFEQFINQKQMGAYYTKEDVTHFMTSSTAPARLPGAVAVADGGQPVGVRRRGSRPGTSGKASPSDSIRSSPTPTTSRSSEASSRGPRGTRRLRTSGGFPARVGGRSTTATVGASGSLASARAGEINSADAAVSANIDLETLTLDVIDGLDAPKDVVEAWTILTELKIIDPTCGSGAFLFAALKILQELYAAVLDAARSHAVTSNDRRLAELIAQADEHPSQNYFILKHAALHNLYGVDLMKEATEIARLRLFLKLVAAISERDDLRPLPDLDFNIKPGNVLVGARTVDEVAAEADLMSQDEVLAQAHAAVEVVTDSYNTFRDVSEAGDVRAIKAARKTLSSASDLGPHRDQPNLLRRPRHVDEVRRRGRRPTSPSIGSSSSRRSSLRVAST